LLSHEEDSLVRRALRDSSELALQVGGVALARQPWAGQVAAVLRKYGAGVDLGSPQLIDVSNILEVAEDSVRQELSLAQGTRFRTYVAVTGTGLGDEIELPAYLQSLEHRGKWREVAQLRTGSHWLAEETGRWQQQPREERLCQHCLAAGERHLEDVHHCIFQCPRAAELRAQYPQLFTPNHTSSLTAFFKRAAPKALSSFCRALYLLSSPT
jgi:hypothetical protein